MGTTTTRWPLTPTPTRTKTKREVYSAIETRLRVTSPANAVPDWWVPLVLAAMQRLRCGPLPAGTAIERELADEGQPLDDAAKVALEKAVALVEQVWT